MVAPLRFPYCTTVASNCENIIYVLLLQRCVEYMHQHLLLHGYCDFKVDQSQCALQTMQPVMMCNVTDVTLTATAAHDVLNWKVRCNEISGIHAPTMHVHGWLTNRQIFKKWASPSASDPRAKNTGQRATKGTVLTSQSFSSWCDCRRLGSTWASWRWQDINVGNPLWRRALLWLLLLALEVSSASCYRVNV